MRILRTLPLVVCALMLSSNAFALSLNQKITEGEKNYTSKKFDKAFDSYKQAQIEEPSNEKLKYNLGNSAYKVGKYDDAVKTFKSLSEQTKSESLKEKSLYNLGNSYYKQAKLEDAEKSYLDALKIDSNDLDAKKNLEKVREEIKKRQQQEKDRKDKQKENKNKDDKKEKSKSGDKQNSKDKGKQDNKEDKDKNNKDKKNQQYNKPDKKDNTANKPKSENKSQQPEKLKPGEMSKEEAQRWLDNIKDNSKEVMKRQVSKKPLQGYRSEKDW